MMCSLLRIFERNSRDRVQRNRLHCAVLFLFLLASALCAFGQEATIVGSVTDPSGASVPSVKVTLTNTDTNITTAVSTSGDGQYAAPDLHIGHYVVRAEAKGFKAGEQKGIMLNVGDHTRVDFKLEVGSAQETVTVEATAVAVQTDTGEVSDVITGQQAKGTPAGVAKRMSAPSAPASVR